jgi:hypothetical protein
MTTHRHERFIQELIPRIERIAQYDLDFSVYIDKTEISFECRGGLIRSFHIKSRQSRVIPYTRLNFKVELTAYFRVHPIRQQNELRLGSDPTKYYVSDKGDIGIVRDPNHNIQMKDIHHLMSKDILLKSYHSLKNIKKNNVRSVFDTWAQKLELPRETKNALFKQLDVRGSAEFKNAISSCIQWLANHKLNKYAMIVEMSGEELKSSTWLAPPVIEGLKKLGIPGPSIIIPCNQRRLNQKAVKQALDDGIKTFIHVDDAVYSGWQKADMVEDLADTVKHLYYNGVRFLLAVAYSTKIGMKEIKSREKHSLQLEIFSPITIPSRMRSFPSLSKKMSDIIKNGGPTMTILPHKVPNHASFGPKSLSSNLAARLPKPVYKSKSFRFGVVKKIVKTRPKKRAKK